MHLVRRMHDAIKRAADSAEDPANCWIMSQPTSLFEPVCVNYPRQPVGRCRCNTPFELTRLYKRL